MQKQILGFLEREKKAEIEADLETLINIVNKYKLNWDNEHFIRSNHNLVIDIQRTARKNMNAYQKEVDGIINTKQMISIRTQVNAKLNKLQDKFNYYRLALYTYSLASLLEIMLCKNFTEEYVSKMKNELISISNTYREIFTKASICIENLSEVSLETNILKVVGSAAKSAGNLIGSIPFIKDRSVDDFLQDGGKAMKDNAKRIENQFIKEFASCNNPGISSITKQMDDIIYIYNHTSQIYFDDEKIYLTSNSQ